MKHFFYYLVIILPLLFSCSDDNDVVPIENDDTTFMMEVAWKGHVYHVKSTYDKNGNLVYLDDSFLSVYKNEILKNDSIITYDAGEKSLAYYTSVDEMMDSLELRFIDVEPYVLLPSEAEMKTRTVPSDARAGRVSLFQHLDYGGQVLELSAQYTKFMTIPKMSEPDDSGIDWNDKASSIIVYSNIPLNDSVYVNPSDVNYQYISVPYASTATTGSQKYATNDLRVVFLGYQHKDYGGDVMCIVPNNNSYKCHHRLNDINWNDKMSSCTLRLAVNNLYSDSPSNAYN